MSSKKRSQIWLYFSDLNNGKAKCDYCKSTLSFKGGATCNLKKHILAKHPNINLENEPTKILLSDVVVDCDDDDNNHNPNEPIPGCSNESQSNSTTTTFTEETNTIKKKEATKPKQQMIIDNFISRPISVIKKKKWIGYY